MKKITLILCILSAAAFLSEQKGVAANDLQVFIHMDKRNFYANEAVPLRIVIKNLSSQKQSFTIYERRDDTVPPYTTFQPVVFDMKGRECETIVPYRMENRYTADAVKNMDRRTIELRADEEFVYSMNLLDVYRLVPGNTFRVKSYFFPNFSEKNILYSDNELRFTIQAEKLRPLRMDKSEKSNEITPSEITLLVLDAERSKNWQRMLKYINLEEFINSYSNFIQSYSRAGRYEREEIRDKFKRYLCRDRADYLLNYEIISEDIEDNNRIAHVVVVVDRFAPRITERYKYHYILEKNSNLWLIISMEASVMKGVKQ